MEAAIVKYLHMVSFYSICILTLVIPALWLKKGKKLSGENEKKLKTNNEEKNYNRDERKVERGNLHKQR